jgi:lactoylglutathione lyase
MDQVAKAWAAGDTATAMAALSDALLDDVLLLGPPSRIRGDRPTPEYRYDHFGLTVDNLDAAVSELRAKGAEIPVGPVMRSPGLYLAFVRGPEGVMVELVQR